MYSINCPSSQGKGNEMPPVSKRMDSEDGRAKVHLCKRAEMFTNSATNADEMVT